MHKIDFELILCIISNINDYNLRKRSYESNLLSSLATDLDLMLNDLRSTPPRFIQPRTSISIVSHLGREIF
ncbi:hypothetical protein Bhyg_15221 [Pseudolycoriella hygida]|uniref:Uncharacterized protein n=1 Tax=Pseudolycoriella hygida TaxID=35572 RepID=A0A9Q0MT52_9DIPT|nr:hypothetical protein Bhyg_15221 [Pseudolycoriella hygida]